VSANPQIKPADLDCESARKKWQLPSTSTITILLLPSLRADSHFTIPRRVEGWVDLGTGVMVCSPCPRLYIAVAVVLNTTARGEVRTLVLHTAVRHVPSPITSSSSDSPLCTSMTPSLFHSRLKTYLFYKSYLRSFTSSSRTASTDVCLHRFCWATRFLISFFLIFRFWAVR